MFRKFIQDSGLIGVPAQSRQWKISYTGFEGVAGIAIRLLLVKTQLLLYNVCLEQMVLLAIAWTLSITALLKYYNIAGLQNCKNSGSKWPPSSPYTLPRSRQWWDIV